MGIRNKIPKPVKNIYRKIRTVKDFFDAIYWGQIAESNPQKHAAHEAKRMKQVLLRPINLEDPQYFIEKLSWLKYNVYNNSPLVAKCYNKYEVREYVESKGLGYILNELYGVWDSVDDVPWDDLPEEYVMKITNGYAGHVFKRKGKPFNAANAAKVLNKTKRKYSYYYKLTGDLFVSKTKQRIICEKLLHSNLGYEAPEDYKFYCFNGEPKFVDFMAGRSGGAAFQYKEAFVDLELNDRHDLERHADPGSFEAPVCYEEMIEIAKKLSEDFPFVRVDFYVAEGRPVFGELTFTPTHYQTEQSEIELGKMLDLTEIMASKK